MRESDLRDESYVSVRNAVVRHFETQGTLNIEQMRRLTDAPHATVVRWLDRLVADGVLREHTHGKGAFYTRK